jgi:hypothetical protein
MEFSVESLALPLLNNLGVLSLGTVTLFLIAT